MVESMNGNIVKHLLALGEAGVEALADAKGFTRGSAIDSRDVDALQFTGEEFYAQVMGTNPYLVKVWLDFDDGLARRVQTGRAGIPRLSGGGRRHRRTRVHALGL